MPEISRRQTKLIAALDKDILDSLHKVGFRTNLGYEGTGLMSMVFDKCGGYYLGEFVDRFKLILMVNNLLQTLEQANSSEKGKSS